MRLAHVVVWMFASAACASIVASESLGQAAAREKKRREEQKSKSGETQKPPRTFTDETLQEYESTRPVSDELAPSSEGPAAVTDSPKPDSSSKKPPSSGGSPAADSEAAKREAAAVLRRQLGGCQSRLQAAQAELTSMESAGLVVHCPTCQPGESAGVGEARRMRDEKLANARAKVERVRGECDAIESEARAAGIPPGWLR